MTSYIDKFWVIHRCTRHCLRYQTYRLNIRNTADVFPHSFHRPDVWTVDTTKANAAQRATILTFLARKFMANEKTKKKWQRKKHKAFLLRLNRRLRKQFTNDEIRFSETGEIKVSKIYSRVIYGARTARFARCARISNFFTDLKHVQHSFFFPIFILIFCAVNFSFLRFVFFCDLSNVNVFN